VKKEALEEPSVVFEKLPLHHNQKDIFVLSKGKAQAANYQCQYYFFFFELALATISLLRSSNFGVGTNESF
jgi:hypothetical protein